MKQQIISLLERAKENGRTIGDVLAEVRGLAAEPAASAELVAQYYHRVNECPTINASSAECICWHDKGTGPHPDARVGDIYNGVTLTWRHRSNGPIGVNVPAAPSAADERAPVGDERAAFKKCHAAIIKAISSIARADGPDTRKEDDPELLYRSPVMDEVVRILGALDEYSAALASDPVAGEAIQKAKHDTVHAKTERERVTALAYWLDHQTFEPGMLSIAAATLLAMLDRDAAPQVSPAADGRDAKDAARWRLVRRKLCLTGNGDGTCAMQALNLPASIPGWPEPGDAVAEFCDAAIDAAIAAQQGEGGGV